MISHCPVRPPSSWLLCVSWPPLENQTKTVSRDWQATHSTGSERSWNAPSGDWGSVGVDPREAIDNSSPSPIDTRIHQWVSSTFAPQTGPLATRRSKIRHKDDVKGNVLHRDPRKYPIAATSKKEATAHPSTPSPLSPELPPGRPLIPICFSDSKLSHQNVSFPDSPY